MNRNMLDLLALIPEDKYETSSKLAKKMKISEKTVRNRLSGINTQMKNFGARIESKKGEGYRLMVENRSLYHTFLREKQKELLSSNTQERTNYLLYRLINSDGYVKVEDLCKELFVSERTLSRDLQEVERILEKYYLKLERKPYHGTKVLGSEIHRRLCLTGLLKENYIFNGVNLNENVVDSIKIILSNHDYHISDTALQNLMYHILIAIERIKSKHYVEFQDINDNLVRPEELELAEKCVNVLEQYCEYIFPKAEVQYLALHLAGKRVIEQRQDNENLVIDEEIREIVREMLEVVNEAFKVDCRNDLELIMSLGQHLVPLRIRAKYNLHLNNPILSEIKKDYSLEFAMAAQASTIITKYYNVILDEDELGYIALSFALSLERKRSEVAKKHVLLVCASGKGSARLYMYQFKQVFGNYISKIETCMVQELESMDLSKVDYIFTTVPIDISVPVPIQKLNGFLKGNEIKKVRDFLSQYQDIDVKRFFWPDLFFVDENFENKDDVLKFMCEKIGERRKVPDSFYNSVIERENLAQTEFGNLVAIPHPNQAQTKETFVSVCILKKPIKWMFKQVQVVFLLSISKEHTGDYLQKLYTTLSRIILDEDIVKGLIKDKSFSGMLKLLEQYG